MITRHEADTPKHPNNAASCFVEVSLGRSNSDQPSVDAVVAGVVVDAIVVMFLNLGGQIRICPQNGITITF